MATRQFNPRWKNSRSSAKSRPPTCTGNSDPMKQKSRPSSSQRCRDFRRRRHCPLEQRELELPLELPAGPLLLSDDLQIELALLGPLALAKDDEMVRPGDLSQQCRDFLVRPDIGLVELPHAKQVRPRKAPASGMNASDVRGQPLDHATAPLGRRDLAADLLADLPVQLDQRNLGSAWPATTERSRWSALKLWGAGQQNHQGQRVLSRKSGCTGAMFTSAPSQTESLANRGVHVPQEACRAAQRLHSIQTSLRGNAAQFFTNFEQLSFYTACCQVGAAGPIICKTQLVGDADGFTLRQQRQPLRAGR